MLLFPFAAVGFGLLAAGQIKQGIDQAAMLRANARQLRKEARLVLKAGRRETENIRDLGERQQSEIIALAAATGQAGGSPLEVIVDQSIEDESQALTVLFASRAQAAILKKRAKVLDKAAGSAILGGALSGLGSLLRGGAEFSGGGGDNSADTGGTVL
ncbi:MAG: hypothetical protein V3W44_08560 [Dehalococcoidales bacterium]